jgi:hypothetical protein
MAFILYFIDLTSYGAFATPFKLPSSFLDTFSQMMQLQPIIEKEESRDLPLTIYLKAIRLMCLESLYMITEKLLY